MTLQHVGFVSHRHFQPHGRAKSRTMEPLGHQGLEVLPEGNGALNRGKSMEHHLGMGQYIYIYIDTFLVG